MRPIVCVVFVLMLAGHPTLAFAAKGVVVANPSGCDYFIVDANRGYALLEWYGGSDPSEGDVLTGDFESYGFKDIYNINRDAETRVWVEDYMLGQSSVVEKYHEKCD
jgi:hypothetical protein